MKRACLCALLLVSSCTAPTNGAAENLEGETIAGANEAVQPGQPSPGPQPSNGNEQPRGDIQLGAAPAQAQAGATITLRLNNASSQTVGYNLCTSTLQTAAGTAVPTDRVCTMELRSLPPGQSTTYPYELPARLDPGSYRFSTNVERMETGERHAVISNDFEVR